MSAEDRRAHERDLLRGYHQGLVDAGVRDFTFDDCLESYRISALYPFLLTVSMSMFLAHTDRDREVWTQLLRNSAELVADLGSAERPGVGHGDRLTAGAGGGADHRARRRASAASSPGNWRRGATT